MQLTFRSKWNVLLQLAELRCAQQLLVGDMLMEAVSGLRELSGETALAQHLATYYAGDVTLQVGVKVGHVYNPCSLSVASTML